MKIDDAPLTRYLVKQLQPLTEADPTLLANYVVALLKNNKPKKDLQKLCIDQLFDFLGEGTKTFVVKLFHALEDGTISAFHDEQNTKEVNEVATTSATVATTSAATVTHSGDNTEQKTTTTQPEKVSSADIGVFSDQEEEGSDDEDDDRNHKHRRRVSRSRSLDRDTVDEGERAPYRKRNRPTENGQSLRGNDLPIGELRRGSGLIHMGRDGLLKNERRLSRDHGYSAALRLNGDGSQRGGSRGAPAFRGDGPGSRFEHPNGLSRGVLGRGRGAATGLWAPHEQRCAPFDGSDFSAAMLPSGPSPTNLYTGRAIPSRPNPPHSPWTGYSHHLGIANGALDQTLPLNTGMQGPRGVPISAAMGVGVNIGIGMTLARPRCPDFEERGYCLRGDLCPMEHGANRIVVEDVQSLSQFNLPVALPSGRSMAMGSVPVSGPSSAAFSPNLGLPSRSVREMSMSTLDEPGLSKGTLAATAGTEPDLYDPDQPLWNKEQPDVADEMRRLPSFRKGQEESEWEGGASERRQGRTPDDGNPERYGRSTTTSGASQGLAPGQSVWDRIGPVDRGESKVEGVNQAANSPVEGLPRLKATKKEIMEEHECQSSRQRRWEGDIDGVEENLIKAPTMNAGKGRGLISNQNAESASRAIDKSSRSMRGGGARSMTSGSERAQRTLYVSCIPNNNNRKELLMAHFQKFGAVMDIRIPSHSDRAFVQFSQRADAEAALMSPEAVMGNRFIRLSWANRDSIQDSSGEDTSLPSNGRTGAGAGHVKVPHTFHIRGKEKAVAAAASESNQSENAGRLAGSNVQPSSSVIATQKKQEELEQMKEEIRRKQEELAQKRDDFRRKLERLSKQGSGIKADSEADQPSNKRPKLEKLEGSTNDNKQISVDVSALPHALEKSVSPSDQPAAASTKLFPDASKQGLVLAQISSGGLPQPSPKGLRSHFPRPSVMGTGSLSSPQWGPSRYKLDNRTTIFRILPPFPDGLLDITTLKEHFSSFGELSNLEVEDADQKVEGNLTEKSVVRVTFGSRRAAEQAFVQGRWFQGVSLQVVWVNLPINVPSATSIGSKQGDVAKDTPLAHNPRPFKSGAGDKVGPEDRKSPRCEDRLVTDIASAEDDVQLAAKGVGEYLRLGQVLASRPQSYASTKLDGTNIDSPHIHTGATPI